MGSHSEELVHDLEGVVLKEAFRDLLSPKQIGEGIFRAYLGIYALFRAYMQAYLGHILGIFWAYAQA